MDRRPDIKERQSGTGGKGVHEERSGDTGETPVKYMRVERLWELGWTLQDSDQTEKSHTLNPNNQMKIR